MNTTDFLRATPLPQSDPKTRKVFEQVEKMHLSLNTLDLNQRATYYYTIDNARLEDVAKVAGMGIRNPTFTIPNRHIMLAHDKGMIILKGPEMRITETYQQF